MADAAVEGDVAVADVAAVDVAGSGVVVAGVAGVDAAVAIHDAVAGDDAFVGKPAVEGGVCAPLQQTHLVSIVRC